MRRELETMQLKLEQRMVDVVLHQQRVIAEKKAVCRAPRHSMCVGLDASFD
jgi:hypothetical protein